MAEQEPVQGRSLPELRELLRRQERLLGDRALVSRLPDAGKRVAESVERLRVAVAREERRRRRRPGQERAAAVADFPVSSAGLQEERPGGRSEPVLLEVPREPPAASASGSLEMLAGVLGCLSLAGHEGEAARRVTGGGGRPSPATPERPRYVEARAKDPTTPRSRFKTNALPGESSSSGVPSPEGLSASERRCRDKKHLDDVTAARLPPLHHRPMQLLPIAESIAIQIQQKELYEEMQAKVAAQRLTERLGIKMAHYEPEGKMVSSYSEVRDEEGYSSAED